MILKTISGFDFEVANNDEPTCRVTILSKNAKYLETKVESQYGTEYHVDRISESLISQWQVFIRFSSAKSSQIPITS